MYKIINFINPSRILPQPDIFIVKTGFKLQLNKWNMPWCISKTWRLYWNDTPGAILEFNDRSITMVPNTMVLIPPHTPAMAHTTAPFIHNFVEFTCGSSFSNVKNEPLVFDAGRYIGILANCAKTNIHTLALYVLVGQLLLDIPPENLGDDTPQPMDERIKKALEYMEKHQKQKYSLDSLCRCTSLSKPRFLALFKQNVGITPKMHWFHLRMELVGKMLFETDLSISEIAVMTGFVDRSHLSRVFKKHTGATPAQVRKKMHKS